MSGEKLTPELLLGAYEHGLFPMAENRHAEGVVWMNPKVRGIIPLDGFNVPRKLKKVIGEFEITADKCFADVIRLAADSRSSTWINDEIIDAYIGLHKIGHAHSVEAWKDGKLVGGLYGVSIGAAFFGESMFSLESGASKVALVHLVDRLKAGGYLLLDTQFVNEHLKQFGVIEIPREVYMEKLKVALQKEASFA